MTLPPLAFVAPPGACTTTSVTTFANTQPDARLPLPAQSPTGSLTSVNVAPASVERYRPAPVAAYTIFGLAWSTATRKPNASAGTPAEWAHVLPPSVE